MKVNIHKPTEVAQTILQLVNSLQTQYGKSTLSKILYGSESITIKYRKLQNNEFYGSLNAFSLEQIKDIISQLISQGYLQALEVGTDYEIKVIGITGNGSEALKTKPKISINIPKVYAPEFVSTTETLLLSQELIDEYYSTKTQLLQLQEKETRLKEAIKKAMIEHDVPKVYTQKIDFYCRKIDRVIYPKEKIESFVPENILEKIRTIQPTTVLIARLKKE